MIIDYDDGRDIPSIIIFFCYFIRLIHYLTGGIIMTILKTTMNMIQKDKEGIETVDNLMDTFEQMLEDIEVPILNDAKFRQDMSYCMEDNELDPILKNCSKEEIAWFLSDK
ncbi:MAG: hypothetical protein GY804_08930 [Alphaproteobacteria bacterium]|nr:hypothetical protein [Alphaproteobacteria bacterium]